MDSSHKALLAIEAWLAKLRYYATPSGKGNFKLHQQYTMWNAISASVGRDKTVSCDEDNSSWHSILSHYSFGNQHNEFIFNMLLNVSIFGNHSVKMSPLKAYKSYTGCFPTFLEAWGDWKKYSDRRPLHRSEQAQKSMSENVIWYKKAYFANKKNLITICIILQNHWRRWKYIFHTKKEVLPTRLPTVHD